MPASQTHDLKPRPVRGFGVSGRRAVAWRVAKALLYALLAGDVALYALHGTAAETLDTAAWLVLLALFEWETGGWRLGRRTRRVVHAARALAAAAVLVAWTGYARDGAWLDFANATAWLAVVLLLEAEVRVPARHVAAHRARRALTWAAYALLGGFVATWALAGMRGDAGALLDAWDAALWLLAFVAIELNVFGLDSRDAKPGAPAARSDP